MLNLQSTGARRPDLKRLWERFKLLPLQAENSVLQPIFKVHYYVEIQDIVINVNGLCRDSLYHPWK